MQVLFLLEVQIDICYFISTVGAEASPEAVEATAVFLCETLRDVDDVGPAESRAVHSKLGHCPRDLLTKVHREVQTMVKNVPSDFLDTLFSPNASDSESANEFGHGFAFSFDDRTVDTDLFADIDDEPSVVSPTLNIQFALSASAASSAGTETNQEKGADVSIGPSDSKMDWLQQEVKKVKVQSSLGLTADALSSKLLVELTSAKSSDELQTDVSSDVNMY